MIDLRRLRVLRAVAEFGTVTAAAEALHTTPSAASQQIRALGRELGVTLLEPHGRGVVLTSQARDLLGHAELIENQWELARTALHRGDGPAGPLHLCGIPTAVAGLVAPAAARLARRHPRLVVAVSEAEPGEGARHVLTGTADLSVFDITPATPAAADRRVHQTALLTDPYDLLVPTDHRLADRERVTLADAATERWVVEATSSSSRAATVAACTMAGFVPQLAHEARQWSVVAALVGHGHGVALVPRLAALPAVPAVTRLRLRGRHSPSRKIVTCTRSGSQDHPAIHAAITELVAAAERERTHPPAGED